MINVRAEELPKLVWVESDLGLLGSIEKTEMMLVNFEYDIRTMMNVATVQNKSTGSIHTVAFEHLHPIQEEQLDLFDASYPDTDYPCEELLKQDADDAFRIEVETILDELKELLVAKNNKYGNSALEPVRVFSKASPKEQILVRLDDKLSRLRTQHITEDEDVITDLMGYLVLLKMAK